LLAGRLNLQYSPPVSDVPEAPSAQERRRAPRYPLAVPVKVLYGSAPLDAQFGVTADVSAHGALLLLPRPVRIGTEMVLRISLPRNLGDRTSPPLDMRGFAVVRRQSERERGAAVGIEISDLTPVGST
jgi:hypothetical protein